jgi:uncharacterized phage-associated protein
MFNVTKTTHLAAHLIEKSGGSLNILKLVKLLYICDREFMKTYAKPITFDRFVSMPQGPVLSSTYNLMTGSGMPQYQEIWDRTISDRENHMISMNDNSFTSILSVDEREVADFVYETFKSFNQWELVKYTHENFEEWSDPNGSSNPIQYQEVFMALGYTKQDAVIYSEKIESDDTDFSYDIDQMQEAVQSDSVKIPHGIKGKALREFILERADTTH